MAKRKSRSQKKKANDDFLISLYGLLLILLAILGIGKYGVVGRFVASLSNCVCYTFSAIVIKFIAESDLITAIAVQATTNFFGCYFAMMFCDKILNRNKD